MSATTLAMQADRQLEPMGAKGAAMAPAMAMAKAAQAHVEGLVDTIQFLSQASAFFPSQAVRTVTGSASWLTQTVLHA